MTKKKRPDKRKEVSVSTWTAALAAVSAGMPLRKAAAAYKVSCEPLRLRHKGLVPIDARTGPQLMYISEGGDKGLLEIIHYRALHGMCIDFEELQCMLRQVAEETSTRPLGDDFPNSKFVTRWIAKHPEISVRRSQFLDVKRAESSSSDAVMRYYNNLKEVLTKLNIVDKPERIWNCDETGICPQGHGGARVICPKGLRANVQAASDRENTSIMGCISASGARMAPMYIFKGKYRTASWMKGTEDVARCAMSESSNINGKLFLHWFKWFVELLPPERPQLLLLDGHFAHIQLAVVKYGMEHDVHLFVLPAHTSHFLQPLDVSVFGSFKTGYLKALKRFPANNANKMPTKDDIAGLARYPLIDACCPKNAKKGFKKTGIFPLSLDAMMKGIIGNAPDVSRDSLPHLSLILGQIVPPPSLLNVSERQKRVLRELNLDVDALNVVNLLRTSAVAPIPQKRKRGEWVDENYSGGVLLSYDMMVAAVKAKADAKAQKEVNKKSAPCEKVARELMNLHDKHQHQTVKTKRVLLRAAKQMAREERGAVSTKRKTTGVSKLPHKRANVSDSATREQDIVMSMVI